MQADALLGPNPACMAVKGIDCHGLQERSGFGIDRSSLRTGLHATSAVLSLCFEAALCAVLFAAVTGRDRGLKENRKEISVSAMLPGLLWVLTPAGRAKQGDALFETENYLICLINI